MSLGVPETLPPRTGGGPAAAAKSKQTKASHRAAIVRLNKKVASLQLAQFELLAEMGFHFTMLQTDMPKGKVARETYCREHLDSVNYRDLQRCKVLHHRRDDFPVAHRWYQAEGRAEGWHAEPSGIRYCDAVLKAWDASQDGNAPPKPKEPMTKEQRQTEHASEVAAVVRERDEATDKAMEWMKKVMRLNASRKRLVKIALRLRRQLKGQ